MTCVRFYTRQAGDPQVPVLLGAGRPYFHSLPEHIQLRLLQAVPASGVTHLHYEGVR
jgi:hypothetical protein